MRDTIKCDICGDMAGDSLKEKYAPKGIKNLCHSCGYEIYKFEIGVVDINHNLLETKGADSMVSKYDLVKAKVVCMKHGLNMKVSQNKKGWFWKWI